MARKQFEIIIFSWAQKYLDKSICPVCQEKPVRTGLRTCSPKCNNKFYKNCCIVNDWSQLKAKALKRDNYQCVVYGCQETKNLEVDHITAIALGGDEWDLNNLQTLCFEHHKVKTKEDIRLITQKKKAELGMED